ncbi:STAS domain-containing protein [Streptomyces sp. NBC_00306]|uniref:STAS domain-containing protein n=1 Tax=Streptomyces sp. NBC_00306 TaxID=2975708 RepID=UPI002E287636|nr:STAS domain-containing protein [Streptomyces sp. NBC_00306]
MRALTVTVRDASTGPVVEIAGDLDYETAPRLRQAVEGLALEPGTLLVLDLARLELCDSSGITAFIVARNRAIAAQAEVALTAVPAHTARVLRVVGLDQIFNLYPDADSAALPSAVQPPPTANNR